MVHTSLHIFDKKTDIYKQKNHNYTLRFIFWWEKEVLIADIDHVLCDELIEKYLQLAILQKYIETHVLSSQS